MALLSRSATGMRLSMRSAAPMPMSSRRSTVRVCALGKQELVDILAEKLDMTKTKAADTLNILLNVITAEVTAGNDVNLTGFGSWKRTERAARSGRNPKTGEHLDIPAKLAPKFTFGQPFKDIVNGDKALKEPKAPKPKAVKAPKEPKAPKAPKAVKPPKEAKAPKPVAAAKSPAAAKPAAAKAPAKK